MQIFISYSWNDSSIVLPIADLLRNRGANVWLDRDKISAGESLVEEIESALKSTDCFVLFASKNYFEGHWTKKEYRVAVNLAISGQNLRMLVVRLDESELPLLVSDLLHVKYSDRDQAVAEIFGVNSATQGARREVPWQKLDDHLMFAFAEKVVTASAEPGRTSSNGIVVADGNQRSYRLDVSSLFLENEILMEELRQELEIYRIQLRLVGRLRKKLVEGGLGIFEGPFELQMETKQEDLARSRTKVREQMSTIVARVWVSERPRASDEVR